MRTRENVLRAIRFDKPDCIPMGLGFNSACWHHYPQDALQDLMESHPLLYPDFKRSLTKIVPDYPPWQRAGKPYTDLWGCVWETTDDGIAGAVTGHPLESWDDFDGYTPPDPGKATGVGGVDWDREAEKIRKARDEGRMVRGGLRHGHTFLMLSYIRGYQNLIFDMADGEPRLRDLIDMVERFNAGIVRGYLDLGVEWMGYPEDLGMQVGPMLSPNQFREFIKPSFERLMAPARKAGCVVHMHSDGDIRELVDDLIDGGVQVLNLQDLVNGIDWIRDNLKGRICIDLDIDRQNITRFGTPQDVDSLIKEAVEKLGSKEGGLTMMHEVYPGIPIENIKALMDAMEKYTGYYS